MSYKITYYRQGKLDIRRTLVSHAKYNLNQRYKVLAQHAKGYVAKYDSTPVKELST